MGRHSRKGSAPSVSDTGQRAAAGRTTGTAAQGAAGQTRGAPGEDPGATGQASGTGRRRRAPGGGQDSAGTPAHGTPQYGTPSHGTPQYGAPAYGTPQYGTPAHGTPQYGAAPYGTPPYGAQAYGGGGYDTPAHGTPGTPAYGIPAYRTVSVRGGHPQHDEDVVPHPEGYGHRRGAHRAAPPGQGESPQSDSPRSAPEQAASRAPFVPGPRRESASAAEAPADGQAGRAFKGRTLTGIAAAAVTTVLAVVVAGQVADRGDAPSVTRAADGQAERASGDTSASRSDDRITPTRPAAAAPSAAPSAPAPTYEQLMTRQFPIDPKLDGSGVFEAVPGLQKAPGKGRLVRYRIDVEKGIGLDPRLFAEAVHKTLNDERSWAGQGAMAFERISSGEPEFVITLASPGTTGEWCRKSGLDTTVDNVSCDSANTERVMINAFRWAQGSETFGPKAMYAYRQMLINHEVGHRLGHGHVSCDTPGALAPVMQQQTKSLRVNGITCRPNPWVYPGS
ncbi:DUF3152 domain-containing protein [Streptomyces sp. NBC_00094]|uniref:DUF3152 domain-containing protein n=1 Tax=Streptomyces sp. NBC_00094 TaxID=2903620 RepID=UPI002256276F|nr:DUF3152 domain-containing protein [Streptomyces sp. NBC_00094]MCX5393034.1 DUF3152 domain-containing protein [Streptomyces sp. NBC_00094]